MRNGLAVAPKTAIATELWTAHDFRLSWRSLRPTKGFAKRSPQVKPFLPVMLQPSIAGSTGTRRAGNLARAGGRICQLEPLQLLPHQMNIAAQRIKLVGI